MDISKMISLLTSTIKELGSSKNVREHIPDNKSPLSQAPSFFDNFDSSLRPTLQQERHEYNMEGLFSPHNLPLSSGNDFIWIDHFFIKKTSNLWLAVSGIKLLELYTRTRLKKIELTIPLLVSEPFPSKNVRPEMLQILGEVGVELEYLGRDTIVMRSIPDWMNGFPLKDILGCLLLEKSFGEIIINPSDWSQTTWEEMLEYFPVDELIAKKVVVDLATLLREKLK